VSEAKVEIKRSTRKRKEKQESKRKTPICMENPPLLKARNQKLAVFFRKQKSPPPRTRQGGRGVAAPPGADTLLPP